jgi:hypothetical protein
VKCGADGFECQKSGSAATHAAAGTPQSGCTARSSASGPAAAARALASLSLCAVRSTNSIPSAASKTAPPWVTTWRAIIANMGAFARRAPARSAGIAAPTGGVAAHPASPVASREFGPLALGGHGRSPRAAPARPSPPQPEAPSVPGDDGLRLTMTVPFASRSRCRRARPKRSSTPPGNFWTAGMVDRRPPSRVTAVLAR